MTDMRKELERVRNVADMLCSAHSVLRDRYERSSFILDVLILAASTWIVSLVFIDPKINNYLTPGKIPPAIWIGFLSIATFFLTVLQMRMDWRGRADAHRKSCQMYSEVKQECRRLLLRDGNITPQESESVLSKYILAEKIGTNIPDTEFLKQKQRHKFKVAISRHLDRHPGASILLTKIKFLWRDNFGSEETSNGDQP